MLSSGRAGNGSLGRAAAPGRARVEWAGSGGEAPARRAEAALPKAMPWPSLKSGAYGHVCSLLCVFLASLGAECSYVFWMVGICMISKTSLSFELLGTFCS